MKIDKSRLAGLSFLFVFLFVLTTLYGCETCKGVGRDIKNADEWFREHAW